LRGDLQEDAYHRRTATLSVEEKASFVEGKWKKKSCASERNISHHKKACQRSMLHYYARKKQRQISLTAGKTGKGKKGGIYRKNLYWRKDFSTCEKVRI